MWTAFASVFSLLLGYSRVPYAAALDGNYFRAFARVDPKRRFPTVSLLALGGVAMLFCFLRLADVIAALVVIRILLQFIVQAVGMMVLRKRRPDMPRPFRMWLYPAAGADGDCGFTFHSAGAQEFSARDSLRGRDPDRGIGDLFRSLVAQERVAIERGSQAEDAVRWSGPQLNDGCHPRTLVRDCVAAEVRSSEATNSRSFDSAAQKARCSAQDDKR